MANNKDILEAQKYNRRRLISAFVSGTPGGREVEGKSYTVPVIVGAVIGALVLVGAVAAGFFAPTLSDGWEERHLLVVSDTGARYFTIDGTLYPIRNVTSARLLSNAGGDKGSSLIIEKVSASVLAGKAKGGWIGIEEAPEDVPSAASLQSSTWYSCAEKGTGKPATWIGQAPDGFQTGGFAVVTVEDETYLVNGGKRHLVEASAGADVVAILSQLGISNLGSSEVGPSWRDLTEEGSPIKALDVSGDGRPGLNGHKVGTVLNISRPGEGADHYLITGSNRFEQLTEFGYWLWLVKHHDSAEDAIIDQLAGGEPTQAGTGLVPLDWPESPSEIIGADMRPCVTLEVEDNGEVVLGSGFMPDKNLVDSKGASNVVHVSTEAGALIRASDGVAGSAIGAVYLIADTGKTYSLGDDPTDSLALFDYTAEDIVAVSPLWVQAVNSNKGVELTPAAAKATLQAVGK
jgi:type VII secretion protein EccB